MLVLACEHMLGRLFTSEGMADESLMWKEVAFKVGADALFRMVGARRPRCKGNRLRTSGAIPLVLSCCKACSILHRGDWTPVEPFLAVSALLASQK